MRLLYDNAADRSTSLVGSSVAGSLVTANLLTEIKSAVWRTTGTSATLTVTWPTAEFIGLVAFPFCNLTSQATMSVRGFTHAADASPAFDTGPVLCCRATPLGSWGWGTMPLGVNAFTYAGGAYATNWFAIQAVEKLIIDIIDTTNTAGYLEFSRLVTGSYWQPTYNADYGAKVTATDSTKAERTESGDAIKRRGHRHRELSFTLTHMFDTDRNQCYNLITGNGLAKPVFISLFPEAADASIEQQHQIYGSLNTIGSIEIPFYSTYTSSLTIEEA